MKAGIDVGAYFNAVSIQGDSRIFDSTRLDDLIAHLIDHGVDEVILEPTGIYHIPLARALIESGIVVRMVHSTRFGRYRAGMMKKKGDKEDARLLESFPSEHTFEIDKEWLEAKELGLVVLEHYRAKKDLNVEMNRLRRDLYVANPALAFMTPASYKEENLKDLVGNTTLERIRHIERLRGMIRDLEREIKERVESHPDGKILTSIPGISYITAGLLISTYVNVNRFRNVKHFKAFLGFGLNDRESGVSIKVVRTAKAHIPIRSALFRVVLTNARKDNKIGEYYRRYRERMPFRKAVMRVGAKIAEWLYWMLRKREEWKDG